MPSSIRTLEGSRGGFLTWLARRSPSVFRGAVRIRNYRALGNREDFHHFPAYDHADITALAAATLVFDLLGLMVNRSKGATIRGAEALEAAAV
ncbi:hypothetical protein ACVWY0_001302 [Arthrobacter sp. UYNi723]